MHDFLLVVIVLGIVVAVITLVGHGIWVLLAAIFGGGAPKSETQSYRCPHCNRTTRSWCAHCDWCGRSINAPLASELADIEAVQRQLQRLEDAGELKPDEAAGLRARVLAYRLRLVTPKSAEKPAAARPIVATLVETAAKPTPEPAPAKPQATATAVPPLEPLHRAHETTTPPAPPRPTAPKQPAAPPAPPSKTWGEILAGFMEERNIQWAEFIGVLVGGLLIVGASLALVISFWDTLRGTYWKFLVFVGYSSAVFGVGLFAYHRWKLRSTGRGLLTIATLLVPLNFVLMAALSRETWSWQAACIEIASLVVFAALSAFAADVIVPGRRWSMALAVIGNSALILLAARLLGPATTDNMMLAANCAPTLLLAAAMAGQLVKASESAIGWHALRDEGRGSSEDHALRGAQGRATQRLNAADAAGTFTLLGMAVFATVIAMGIIVTKGGSDLYLPIRLHCLAPALALAAWPVLTVGLQIMRGMARRQELEGYRTAGIMTALIGVVLQQTALGMMWPQPLGLVVIGLMNAAGLSFVALRNRFPAAHVGVITSLAMVWLAGFQLAANEWLQELQHGTLIIYYPGLALALLHSVLTARSISSLAGLFLLLAAIAAWLVVQGRARHARPYAIACGVTAAIALLAITVRGITGSHIDGLHATANFAFYGAAAVLASLRRKGVRSNLCEAPSGPFRQIGPDPFSALRETFGNIGWNLLGIAPFWALEAPLFAMWQSTLALAGCLAWLAAVWLLLAAMHRSRDVLMAGQCVLTAATAAATTAWLQTQPWVQHLPRDLLDPRSLQSYGIALAVLSLGWIAARIAARGKPTAERLLSVEEPTLDWLVRHVVVLCNTTLAVVYVVPGVLQELLPATIRAATEHRIENIGGSAAWMLLGTLTAVWIAALWDRWGNAELLGAILLAATVPCLLAGRFADQVAVASMLRWSPAVCFAGCSVFVWCRERLTSWCRRAKTRIVLTADGPQLAQTTLAATTAAPVILLTLVGAWLQLTSVVPGGPVADSFFGRLGTNASYLVPLVIVIATVIGYAVREKSAQHAFAAGLVAELATALGYTLSVVLDPERTFGSAETVTLIQCLTITAAAWAIVWLVARRFIDVWREDGVPKGEVPSTALMKLQLGLAYIGNAILLGIALWVVIFLHPDMAGTVPSSILHWPTATGMPLGWLAFVLTAGAGAYRILQLGRQPSADAIGLFGMAVIALAACTVSGLMLADGSPIDTSWAYRVLMLGWAGYGVLLTFATWPIVRAGESANARAAVNWVRAACIAAVLLGLKAAFFHGIEERLWAAGAIAVASAAGATMAVCRRREGWAMATAVGVNLAASLVVWYVEETRNLTFAEWRLELLHANIIASSTVALVWLAARRWLYEAYDLTVQGSPYLAVQIALPTAANILLLAAPVVQLLNAPACLLWQFREIGDLWGWTAVLLAAAAVAWYHWRTMPEKLPHVVGGLLLGIGVLAACDMAYFNPTGAKGWLEYHVLLTAWASAALILLGIGFLSRWRRTLPPSLLARWITICAALAIFLAMIHSPVDRMGYWWSLRAIVAMSEATAILALWQRLPGQVVFSGLLWNAAGVVAWLAWGDRHDPLQLIHANAIGLAGASIFWTVLQLIVPRGVPHFTLERRPLAFAHVAAAVALTALGAVAAVGLFAVAHGYVSRDVVTRLGWIALSATAAAFAVTIWDRLARRSLCGLYFAGLTTHFMAWQWLAPAPRELCWRMSAEISGYLLVAAVLGWLVTRGDRGKGDRHLLCEAPEGPFRQKVPVPFSTWRLLRIPMDADRWPTGWYMRSQAALAVVSAGVATYVSIDFFFDGIGRDIALFGLAGRTAGIAGALMVLGATIVMAWQCGKGECGKGDRSNLPERPDQPSVGARCCAQIGPVPFSASLWRTRWQYAALAAGLLLNAATGWAALDSTTAPTSQAPWLHRSTSLLVAAAMMILVSSVGLRRFLPKATDWIAAGRKAAPVFVSLTLVVLALVLSQEAYLCDLDLGTPMTNYAIAVVTATLALLVAICITLAVSPRLDPFKLSDNGRQLYVYVAEVLVALTALRLRMTIPWLFHLGFIERYWMFLAMGIAFAGAGLSEFFDRRRLPVLSQPLERTALLLPLLPAVGFWFAADPTFVLGIMGRTPMLWLLMSAFYGSMAYMRRSPLCIALSVLTANIGLWVALHQSHIAILEHPQLWLIPIALAVLVAEFLNHDRLSAVQSAVLRYLALSVIYLSSTADMFIAGLGKDWRLPLVLMLFSVGGIFAGLFLRIRSFLLLGIVFLLLDIVSIIWYAAVDLEQTWLWWVCLIAVGIAIIAVFGMFEKRRNDLLLAVEKLKQWQR